MGPGSQALDGFGEEQGQQRLWVIFSAQLDHCGPLVV